MTITATATATAMRFLRFSRNPFLSSSVLEVEAPLVSASHRRIQTRSLLLLPHGRYAPFLPTFPSRHTVPCSAKSYGFRSFCTIKDLTTKKCVPCNAKDLQPMTEETANALISKVEGWELVNEGGMLKLNRSWKVKSFTRGLELFQLVADVAESEGHHPDLHLVGWNNVTIEIWTHAVGGLTENDFILAAKINKLPLDGLLRHKAKNPSSS